MLRDLFPRAHHRYSLLPVLGSTLGGFARLLVEQEYSWAAVRRHVRRARRLDDLLLRSGCHTIDEITRAELWACVSAAESDSDIHLAATARLLDRYLGDRGILPLVEPSRPVEGKLADYSTYLRRVRGLAPSTIRQHLTRASQFLAHVGSDLSQLTSRDIEDYIRLTGSRVCRATLQHVAAELRSFLRFLAARREAPSGLDAQIDTPRVYRSEQLPRALPWETVRAFLHSIEVSKPIGLRDRAIFLLIATYGLRSSQVVALKLEDIEWRVGRLRVSARKSTAPLVLPLTDAVGDSLVAYLRQGRPEVPCREIFVRHRAPRGVLKRTGVTDAFQAWSRRSGLEIPFQGPHCLRHSYAVHLLRQGTSLKTIGDLLGHRSAESTCVYLRLAVEDLRGVALPLPAAIRQEVRP